MASSSEPITVTGKPGAAAWSLVRGRLRPPASRSQLVTRPRVDTLLDQSQDYEVVLVSAPSGYGKTTAVSQWMRSMQARQRAIAWVSLDEMDCEPGRILMYLMASLSNVSGSLHETLAGLLEPDFEGEPLAALRAMLAGIEAVSEDIYLVVDDLHGSLEPRAVQIFSHLVNHGLSNFHILLIMRDAVELPLARAKMRRALLELGPHELQFSRSETTDYFGLQPDLAITDDDVALLRERTDGWIAGLQLAVLSLRGRANAHEFIQSFSGHNRDIADLLTEEVLSKLSDDLVQFLEHTSVLSSFNADLCDQLLERTDSAEMIQKLEDGNFFIFPMDDERVFYRYHRLFAEHLRRNLERRYPGRSLEIHRFAAEWFRDHDLPVRACMHARRSADPSFLGGVLEAVALRLRESGYGTTITHYASQLPPDVANLYPRMQLDRIYALTLSWRFDEAREVLEQVRRALRKREGVADEIYPELVHREGQLALLTDDNATAEVLCSEWLQLPHRESPFDVSVVRTSLICTRAERYEFDGLERAADIRKGFERAETAWACVWHDSIIGACYLNKGELAKAEVLFRRALADADNLGLRISATPSMPALYLAELLYERGDLDASEALLNRHFDSAMEMGMLGQLAAGYVTRARIALARGEPDRAFQVLDEGESVAERRRFSRLHHVLMLERYRMLLDRGDVDKCFRIARADGLMSAGDQFEPGAATASFLAPQALAWAGISLARNRVAEATDLIERWRKFAISRSALRPAMQFTLLGMRASVLKGDRPRAARLLREALSWSDQCGFRRSLVDGGEPVLELVAQLDSSDQRLMAVAREVLRIAGRRPSQTAPAPEVDAPVEALNARETEILRLVEQGMMNKQIASELGLTVGTVKWYMQQIFSKLAVRRRSQAIHKARVLGFIR